MPVILPPRPQRPPPTPPRVALWLVVCACVIAGAAAYTLATWPKGVPAGTVWFWIRVLGFPVLACAIAYGFRLLYFERERERQDAEHEQWLDDCAEATRFAQEPVALLASGYLCSLGSVDVAGAMVDGVRPLESGVPAAGGEALRHTALRLIDDAALADRYASCFRELLAMIDDALDALPPALPFEIRLDCPTNIKADVLRDIWQRCWAQTGHRAADVFVLAHDESVMAVDAWLDAYGGPALEKYTLFVAAQLYDKPHAGSAEAAVALLFGWTQTAQRNGAPIRALMHRPVERSSDAVLDVLRIGVQWGHAKPEQVKDVWQTGLASADKPALLVAASELELGASNTDDLSGFHDMDLAIGHAGGAAAWLAIALAAEHAVQSGTAQAIATRGRELRVAVVQPPPVRGDGHTQAPMENENEGIDA
ncbi:hypothetical protein [Burkholderia metallica]|uniref:hypothetical protein n=1 Tax=Burkholderia metallica TaxID=488729 RepID=UPI0020C64E4E|nr:hypothetical protein [Burkholderia metallica]